MTEQDIRIMRWILRGFIDRHAVVDMTDEEVIKNYELYRKGELE